MALKREIHVPDKIVVNYQELHNAIIALGNNYDGFRTGNNDVYVIAVTDDNSQDALAAQIVEKHNSLIVGTDKTTITADDTEIATITCSDATIAGDSDVDYEVRDSGGEIDFSGSVSVVGGVATCEFTTPIADTYQIRIKRPGATDYEDGYIEVVAQ